MSVVQQQVCQVCGRNKGSDVRLCCEHPDAERTCSPCYVGGKDSTGKTERVALHRDHVGYQRKPGQRTL